MNNEEKLEESIKLQINLLASKDLKERKKARLILIDKGKKAVPYLIDALKHSEVYKVRWEAAKALGEISDVDSIPILIIALNDSESDVAWLAGEALKNFKKAAWKELLEAVIDRGAESIKLRYGAHHVFRNQKEEGYNDLLTTLRKTLVTFTIAESIALAAYKILAKLREEPKHNKKLMESGKTEKVKS